MVTTSLTCGVGILSGTQVWCGMGFVWMVAIPGAVLAALLLGLPVHFLLNRLKLVSWWHYALAGAIAALPIWFQLGQPLSPERWPDPEPYNALNYVGGGAVVALLFWFLRRHTSASAA
jgi:hypothetical protein